MKMRRKSNRDVLLFLKLIVYVTTSYFAINVEAENINFLFFPKKINIGELNVVLFRASKDVLNVKMDGKKIPFYKLDKNCFLAYLLYTPGQVIKKGDIEIELKSNFKYKRSFIINRKKFPHERIWLKALTRKKSAINDIIPFLLKYENRKMRTVLKQFFYDKLFSSDFIWPVKGYITSPFGIFRAYNRGGFNSFHTGIDIGGNPKGTSVYASNNGIVIIAEDFYARGKTVVIAHGLGIKTLYYHLSKIDVKPGDIIRKGEKLGEIGSTGYSTAPHLHWEFRVNGLPVDPLWFVKHNFEEMISEKNFSNRR